MLNPVLRAKPIYAKISPLKSFVDSEFIMPSVIYIGEKLWYPFRLYANVDGNVCVLVCEGWNLLVIKYCCKIGKKFKVREIMALSSVSVNKPERLEGLKRYNVWPGKALQSCASAAHSSSHWPDFT